MRRGAIAIALALTLTGEARAGEARAQNAEAAEAGADGAKAMRPAHRYGLFPAILWTAFQLVPSPEIAGARGAAYFGMRWQVTPLLYSFGVHRGAPPLRAFLVEPVLRHSGSLEIFVSPEYLSTGDTAATRWLLRPGLRAYFPLAQRGDYLSCSLGTSYAIAARGHSGVAYEGGIYTLFGVLGVQVTYAPAREPADWIATLSVRYF